MALNQKLGQQYQKKDLHQHIYDTPDTYVGGCDMIEEPLPVFSPETEKIQITEVEYIPALYNIFNEILVNARDQVIRLQSKKSKTDIPVTTIKVEIDGESGLVSILNDGSGIDVAPHPTEKNKKGKTLYIPEMIFGHLLRRKAFQKN